VKKLIRWVLLASVLGIAPQAIAEVSTRVCLADGNTPLELADPCIPFVYRDIMVGTKLTIIVSSDAAGLWDEGGLFIADPYRDYGLLSARDFNDLTLDWEGSRFEAAGKGARVYDCEDDVESGFSLYGDRAAVAGDWFIIDYTATAIGDCNVRFYDYSVSDDPVCYLIFSHVRTRDFDINTKVDFADFAVFASHWQETGCNDPNWCQGTDLDTDGNVETDDLMLFADYWLEKTE
jgi:hypothetical protein